jgi:DNA-binding HxlR family transcriptional regulator
MEIAERIELIGKRWKILEKLSKNKYYVSELARKLGKHTPQISENLKQLEKGGLVECAQKEGEKLRYCCASDYAKKIIEAVTEITQPQPIEGLKKWQVNEFVDVLEDQELSYDLKQSYSESFRRICSEHKKEVISNERARDLFKKIAIDPFQDKIFEDLMRSLSALLRGLRKEWSNWVLEDLYPIFVENMEKKKKNEKTRLWAIKKVGQIASSGINSFIKVEARNKFFEIWFSNDTDPVSAFGKEVEQQLANLASEEMFKIVRAKAKDQDQKVKDKAEILLERLKECLLPK